MNVALVYVHPRPNQRLYLPMARRFIRTYMENPPGAQQHDLYVVINGDIYRQSDNHTFRPIVPKFMTHDNSGKDIGAFQMAARHIEADLIVFLGSHIHFRKPGWLDVMTNSYQKNGPGIYSGYGFHNPALHLRTTCFWMPPELLNLYPLMIGNDQRYEFEHGRAFGISKWAIESGFNAWQVTWSGIFPPEFWRHVENEDALYLDQHTDRIGYK